MTLVYDTATEIAYDPANGRFNTPAEVRQEAASAVAAPRGFGNVIPRRMLESGPPPKHPWLTVDLARRELAIGEYRRDRAAVALDSMQEGWDE